MNMKDGVFYTKTIIFSLMLVLVMFSYNTYGFRVSGVVQDTKGDFISEVAVTIKDSSKYSTTTDVNGSFTLESKVAIAERIRATTIGAYSAKVKGNNILIRCPWDGSMRLSLIDCSGRTLWATDAITSSGVALVAFPVKSNRGVLFLQIQHKDGVEFLPMGSGRVTTSNVELSKVSVKVALTAAATYPTLLFRKNDYRDTSFTMTSLDMDNVQVVMTPVEKNCPLPTNLSWVDAGILVSPKPDNDHPIVSVKDATIQKYNDKYLIYCTVYNPNPKNGATMGWSMQFIQFTNFSEAASATPIFMDRIPGFSGYKCAPELVYFEPHKLWYLIWQQQDPAYSTTKTPDVPTSWSSPKPFYSGTMPNRPKLPIDYFLLRDDNNCYLFFTGDDGNVYRAKTSVSKFPNGFDSPVVVISLDKELIFEGSSHYKVKGTKNTYLHLVEGIGSSRFFNAWTSEGIEGEWMDYKVGQSNPFAGTLNVIYPNGINDWTDDVSHGELIRDNPDMRNEVDPCNFQFIYQGKAPDSGGDYGLLPYRLGLLIAK